VVGKGQKSAAPQKAATADASAGPKFQMSPADVQLATKAKATKPGDPLYDSAQKWLRAHGQ